MPHLCEKSDMVIFCAILCLEDDYLYIMHEDVTPVPEGSWHYCNNYITQTIQTTTMFVLVVLFKKILISLLIFLKV